MTLTEEQRPTAGFDLEKARDVEKAMSPMPWIVLEEAHGEMIIIRNPNHPMYIDGIVAWDRVAEANTPDAIGIAYMRENFSNLIGEIERLRASLIDLHAEYINTLEKNPDCSAWDLDEQSDADQRRLRRNAAHAISITEPPIYLQAEQLAARIKELEDAHKRSGAKYAKIINELRSSVYANIPGLDVGKIGPDAAKPRVWQITEERIGLLEYCLETLLDAPDIEEIPGPGHSIEMLRAMLREAEQ